MKYYVIRGEAESDEEAIQLCAKKLQMEGCVTEDFGDNCVKREKEFPTGLPSSVPVAMPHSEAEGVIEDSICLLILKRPVTFHRMDDDNQSIQAEMVFNLAIKDSSGHMAVLRNLMRAFYNEKILKDFYNSPVEVTRKNLEKLLVEK